MKTKEHEKLNLFSSKLLFQYTCSGKSSNRWVNQSILEEHCYQEARMRQEAKVVIAYIISLQNCTDFDIL